VRSRHVVMLAVALSISACSSSNDSTAQDSTTPAVVPSDATTGSTTPSTTTSVSASTTEAPATTASPTTTTPFVPVTVEPANDNVIDDNEWLVLSPILEADPQASFLFDIATKDQLEDVGQVGCIAVQGNQTMADILLSIQSQGHDDQFNNALFAEIKAAMPFICAEDFANVRE
jgi:hypothetical protein